MTEREERHNDAPKIQARGETRTESISAASVLTRDDIGRLSAVEGHSLTPERRFQDNLAQSQAQHGFNSPETAAGLLDYQGYLRANGRCLEAAQLLEQRLGIQQSLKTPPIDQATTCDDIAASLIEAGQSGNALKWTLKADTIAPRF